MKYNILINQKLCIEQDISFKAAALLDLFSELSTWANPQVFEDGVYYQLAYNKILTDLPLVFKKKDTMYRFIKELKEKGFIEQCKKGVNNQNFIRLSSSGKAVLRVGNKSEPFEGSEKNPTRVGKKSEPSKVVQSVAIIEKVVQGSEINPTYNNTTIINDNIYIDFFGYQFLQKHSKIEIDIWESQNKNSIEDYESFLQYFEIKVQEEEIEFTPNKLLGRLKRLKFNWKGSNKNLQNFKLENELVWFIKMFNKVSNRNFKVSDEIKELFAKQFKVGFSGDEMAKAVRNLYSSAVPNKFHLDTAFKFATPEYLLKDDNLNKYLNFKI